MTKPLGTLGKLETFGKAMKTGEVDDEHTSLKNAR